MTAIFSNDFTFAPVVMNWGVLENWESTGSRRTIADWFTFQHENVLI